MFDLDSKIKVHGDKKLCVPREWSQFHRKNTHPCIQCFCWSWGYFSSSYHPSFQLHFEWMLPNMSWTGWKHVTEHVCIRESAPRIENWPLAVTIKRTNIRKWVKVHIVQCEHCYTFRPTTPLLNFTGQFMHHSKHIQSQVMLCFNWLWEIFLHLAANLWPRSASYDRQTDRFSVKNVICLQTSHTWWPAHFYQGPGLPSVYYTGNHCFCIFLILYLVHISVFPFSFSYPLLSKPFWRGQPFFWSSFICIYCTHFLQSWIYMRPGSCQTLPWVHTFSPASL